jgi:bacterial/archaeal transporter family-2 protein
MKSAILIGVAGALATGVAIGVQATLTNRASSMIGFLQTSLWTNLMAGVVSGLAIMLIRSLAGPTDGITRAVIFLVTTSGIVGIMVVMGIGFSLPRTGITAGLSALIFGQLLVSLIVDSTGIGGAEPIPLTVQRIAGVFVMGIAVYLFVPRS